MLFRTSDVVMIVVMISAAAFTYKTKHDADAIVDRIRVVQSRIQAEKDTMDVLKADWSLLTQPGRLQKLVQTYQADLNLQLIDPKQIVSDSHLGGIPYRPAPDLSVENNTGAHDPIVTSGVKP